MAKFLLSWVALSLPVALAVGKLLARGHREAILAVPGGRVRRPEPL